MSPPHAWATYDPTEESYNFHGTEHEARAALDGIVDALRDRSSREIEGWDDNAEQAAVYALHRVAGLELRTVATAGDGTEDGEACQKAGWSHMAEGLIVDEVPPADLATEVERLRAEVATLQAERQAILDAGGDFLWAGGAKTLPEAMAGVLHALDVALTRSMTERDQSPAAKVRDTVQGFTSTDADLVTEAVQAAGRWFQTQPRRNAVVDVFEVSPKEAEALCRACGLDPDEMVGTDREGDKGGDDDEVEYVRLSSEGDEWFISADPLGRAWGSAEDAMAEVPGEWWEEEPGYWLCDPEELDDFLSDAAPGRSKEAT